MGIDSNDLEEIRRHSQRLLDKHPRSLPALQGLATVALEESETDEAASYCDRILEVAPDCLEAWHNFRIAMERQAAPSGLLRINAPMSFGTITLGPALADFMIKYPEMQLQLVLSDDLVDPVQDGFDVTLRIAELESSSLIARKIAPMPRVICASPDYLAKHGIPSHPQELRDHVSLTYGFLLTGNQWKLTGADGVHWIQPVWSLCVNNAEVLRDVALKGSGIALIPEFIAGEALKN